MKKTAHIENTIRNMHREAAMLPDLPKPSFSDRVVGVFSPRQMTERVGQRYAALFVEQEMRQLKQRSASGNAYKASESDRLNANIWGIGRKDINSVLRSELPTIRNRSRYLIRNNPHAKGAINSLTNFVIGTGFSLQTQVYKMETGPDGVPVKVMMEGFNQFVEDNFNDWAEDVDIQASESAPDHFRDAQTLAFEKFFEDGEVFIHRVVDRTHPVVPFRMEIIEPEALNTNITSYQGNPVVLGVELQKDTWRPVAYHIYSAGTQNPVEIAQISNNNTVRIPAERMQHIFKRLYPRQVRGIPHLAVVTRRFFDLDEYTDAELIGSKIAACLSVFIKRPAGQTGVPGLSAASGQSATDQNGSTIANIEPGIIGTLPEGSDGIEVVSPQKPGTTFDMFTRYQLKSVGNGIEGGISYVGMTRDTQKVNYAGGRMAQQMDYQGFRATQGFWKRKYCAPIYKFWFDMAVLNGTVTAPGYWEARPGKRFWQRHEWMPSGWNWGINPLQEAEASIASMRAGITTLDDECANLGYDAKTQLRKKARLDAEAEKLKVTVDSDAAVGRISRTGEAPSINGEEDINAED